MLKQEFSLDIEFPDFDQNYEPGGDLLIFNPKNTDSLMMMTDKRKSDTLCKIYFLNIYL